MTKRCLFRNSEKILLTRKPWIYWLKNKLYPRTPRKKTVTGPLQERPGNHCELPDIFHSCYMIRSQNSEHNLAIFFCISIFLGFFCTCMKYIEIYIMTDHIFLGSFLFYLMFPLIPSNLSSTQFQPKHGILSGEHSTHPCIAEHHRPENQDRDRWPATPHALFPTIIYKHTPWTSKHFSQTIPIETSFQKVFECLGKQCAVRRNICHVMSLFSSNKKDSLFKAPWSRHGLKWHIARPILFTGLIEFIQYLMNMYTSNKRIRYSKCKL